MMVCRVSLFVVNYLGMVMKKLIYVIAFGLLSPIVAQADETEEIKQAGVRVVYSVSQLDFILSEPVVSYAVQMSAKQGNADYFKRTIWDLAYEKSRGLIQDEGIKKHFPKCIEFASTSQNMVSSLDEAMQGNRTEEQLKSSVEWWERDKKVCFKEVEEKYGW